MVANSMYNNHKFHGMICFLGFSSLFTWQLPHRYLNNRSVKLTLNLIFATSLSGTRPFVSQDLSESYLSFWDIEIVGLYPNLSHPLMPQILRFSFRFYSPFYFPLKLDQFYPKLIFPSLYQGQPITSSICHFQFFS